MLSYLLNAPRTVSPPEIDVVALGKEMVAWCEQHKPLHLNMWYSREKMILFKDWKALIQLKEFLPYYEKALAIIGENYLDGTIHNSTAQRFMRIYYKDVKEEEDETVKLYAELKAAHDPQLKSPYQDVLDLTKNNLKLQAEIALLKSEKAKNDSE